MSEAEGRRRGAAVDCCMGRPLLLIALALGVAGCRGETSEPPAAAPSVPDTETSPRTPFDAAPVVFDTTEPPEPALQIPPRPDPPRADSPRPERQRPEPQRPDPRPPAPPTSSVAGSCDVRETEGFCFAYTGSGWTAAEAEVHCDAAPDAAFGARACPQEGRIATCVYRRPSAPEREIVYTYYAPYDPMLAELACPGTFNRLD